MDNNNGNYRSFCDSDFWDLSITWDTEIPDFTQCFQNVVLEMIPCICFWLVAVINIWHTSKLVSRPPLPWTLLFLTKMAFTMILELICIAELSCCGYSIYTGEHVSDAQLCSVCVKAITFIFIMLISLQHKKCGIPSSSVLSIFWLVSSICGSVIYRSSLIELIYGGSHTLSTQKFIFDMCYYPLIFVQFVLFLFEDNMNYRKGNDTILLEEVPFFSFVTFHWFNSIIWKSIKKLLTVEDLPPLVSRLQCCNSWLKFNAVWSKATKTVTEEKPEDQPPFSDIEMEKNSAPSLVLVLFKSFWPWLLIAFVLEGIFDLVKFIPTLILSLLIEFTKSNEYMWRGYFYCILLFITSTIEKFMFNMILHHSMSAALQFKSSLSSAIFRKALKLSSDTRKKYTLGELVSLLAVDIEKLFGLFGFFTFIFGAPIRVVITIIVLWRYLGPSCLASLVVILAVIPISLLMIRMSNSVQKKQMATKDLRLKHISELLNGIKVLKLCAWEIPFMKNIEDIRKKEVKLIKTFQLWCAISSFIWSCSSFIVAISTFVTYILVSEENILDPSIVFVSLSLLSILKFTLFEVPTVISMIIECNISLRRIRTFLTCKERDQSSVGQFPDKEMAISIRKGNFSWSVDGELTLKNINLQIPIGSLVAIVGPVGAGKSSLLSAILGETIKMSGSVDLTGRIAYVPQEAWMLNATLKQNILFNKPLDKKRYRRVISNCSLTSDLQLLPGGDMTEIGENGVNLSGGQKQRISLARAVYRNAEVYLLDDPLSAVDAHVGKHLFDHVISSKGMLRKKTRVLVTHNIGVLPEVDFIVTMKEGEVDEIGSYNELMNKDSQFASFFKEHQQSHEDSAPSPRIETQTFIFNRSVSSLEQMSASCQSLPSVLRMTSVDSSSRKSVLNLIEEEKMEVGKVKRIFYLNYLRNASFTFIFSGVIGLTAFKILEVGGNIWLSEWSRDGMLPDGTQDIALRDLRIGVYSAFGTAQGVSVLFGAIMMAFAASQASKKYHHKMLESVMRSPMSFFDVTPLGRTINRFGKDMNVLDSGIPAILTGLIICFLELIATCAVIGMNTPAFLLFLIPVGSLCYLVQRLYLPTSRQIKRLESTTRSPIYSHFSESIQGISSIRAYCAEEEFVNSFGEKIDTNILCYFYWLCSNRWMALRLDIICNLLVLAASLLTVSRRGVLDGAIVGLSLTYALSITHTLIHLVRMAAEVENQLVSVERIEEYSALPSESPWVVSDNQPSPEWPREGRISFQNYSTRYREKLDLVLKSINMDISTNEKVGIVGRTGAGKSSVTLALFRVIEAVEGTVTIDDVDVSKIGLHDLRSKLTIIPQDPVLFTGTLRVNLDPNSDYSDEELWKSLECSHLKRFVQSLSGGLNSEILEGGGNLSVGQKQLVCLARALLKKTKILVLDEATAAVDMETDNLIQNTIRQEFAKYTVITIAHRLHTIMDYDKVIVMDAGKIVETGKPSDLVQEPNSLFFALAQDAGLT